MAKSKLVVANWKMHLNVAQSLTLLMRLDKNIERSRDVEVVLAPGAFALHPLSREIKQNKFLLAAQNAYQKDEGAYTGEISFTQLRGLVDYVIVGHSERRIYFGEDNNTVRNKVQAALRNGITPIICIGENTHERHAGHTKRVLHDQIVTALGNVTSQEIKHVVIAYEPVWAIGGGTPATVVQIEEAVACIKDNVRDLYGKKAADELRVLYGASVDEEFVGSILSIKGVNGLLVGGASLHYKKFAGIVAATQKADGK